MCHAIPAKGMIRRRYLYAVGCHRLEKLLLRRRLMAISMKHIDEPALARMIAERHQETFSQERAAEQEGNIQRNVSDHLHNPQSFLLAGKDHVNQIGLPLAWELNAFIEQHRLGSRVHPAGF
jgi:hypothetical protein